MSFPKGGKLQPAGKKNYTFVLDTSFPVVFVKLSIARVVRYNSWKIGERVAYERVYREANGGQATFSRFFSANAQANLERIWFNVFSEVVRKGQNPAEQTPPAQDASVQNRNGIIRDVVAEYCAYSG